MTKILDFWADWCAPCRQLAPHLDKIAANNPEVELVKIDTSDPANQELCSRYDVTGLPVVIVLDEQGRVAADLRGSVRPHQVIGALNALDAVG